VAESEALNITYIVKLTSHAVNVYWRTDKSKTWTKLHNKII